jgi:NAD(P)-dependent dehydrogenase (short-subunit alcohol dehydrogenase family)
MTDLFRLDGKVVVVTGGGRGIGLMIARGLLQAGATVYLSSRKKAELDSAVEELATHGPVQAIPADLGTAEGVDALVAELSQRGRRPRAVQQRRRRLGSPAGRVSRVRIRQGDERQRQGRLPADPRAGADAHHRIERRRPARVINTGSIDGIVPPGRGRDNFSYSASKAAVHMPTQHLAGELAPRILVNAIAPGLFESRMTKELLAYGSEAVGAGLPLGRIGQPDDIAGIAVFLASRASSYITGAVIPVDGDVSVIR